LPIKVEDTELLRRFLLREVSEQERDEVEGLYFSDPEYLERLLVVEDELVDEYLQGDLNDREREVFERQYSASLFNKREVDFSRALQQALGETHPPTPKEGWRRRLSNFLFPQGRGTLAWVSVAVLLLAVGLAWWLLRRPGATRETEGMQARGPSANEVIRPPGEARPTPTAPPATGPTADATPNNGGITVNQQPSNVSGGGSDRRDGGRRQPPQTTEPPTRPQPPYEISLHSGVTLGATSDAPPPLNIARGAKRVRLKIQVVKNDYERYRVSLRAVGGGRVWQVRTPKGQVDEAGEWVTVSVPVSVFKGKDYILRVSADLPGGRTETLALRQLRVERK
jgi:hypothetical protein